MNSFNRLVGWVLAGLALLLVVVIAAGSLLGPGGFNRLPAPELEQAGGAGGQVLVGARGPLTLRFDRPMQIDSIEPRLALEPPVKGRLSWNGTAVSFWPEAPLQPGQRYTLRLGAGARSQSGQSLANATSWQVLVREPAVLYLAPTGAPELWRAETGSAPLRLTATEGQLIDYAVSIDGRWIVYSAHNAQSGADLWQIDRSGGTPRLLLPCQADLCINPAYAPDGARIAYSRRQASGTGAEPGAPRLWLLDRASLETAALTADPNIGGFEPAWSPDGRYLAFADGLSLGVRVVDMQDKTSFLLESEMGVTGEWSPDSRYLLVGRYATTMATGEQMPLVIIDAVDVQTRSARPLITDDNQPADYSIPAWSPDGQWLVVARRLFSGLPTKQLWLFRPDGSQRQDITSDPAANYASYRWSPDGSRLVFQRFVLNSSESRPQVVVWERDTRKTSILAEDAYQPQWIP